jgi:hypothetical protein
LEADASFLQGTLVFSLATLLCKIKIKGHKASLKWDLVMGYWVAVHFWEVRFYS